MNINKKNLIIYGIGRLQKDFEYLFPNANIIAYAIDGDNLYEYQGKPCYKLYKIEPNFLKDKLMIICHRKDSKLLKRLNKLGFINKKHYYWLEDLGYLLNDKVDDIYQFVKNLTLKCLTGGYTSHMNNEQRLKKMIYSDSYDGFKCTMPFRYVHIQPDGYVYSCCPGWSYRAVGNLIVKSPTKIWHSNAIKLQRLSIINKTYAFCNPISCPYLKGKLEKTNSRFEDLKPQTIPEEVFVSIDKSCNLHCKSCRLSSFNAKGLKLSLAKLLAKKLIKSDWTSSSERLVLAGQGEVFFSKVYRNMIYDSDITKRDSIEILTNGTLMTKQNLDKLVDIYSKITIFITVDAASEKTYKKLRAGGNYKKLMENLEYLSVLRKEKKVQHVELFFVVQKDNYKEMIDFVKLSKRLGFDNVNFSQIGNWGTFTDKEFAEVSMLKKDGKPKKELRLVLKDPILKETLYEHSNISKFIQ